MIFRQVSAFSVFLTMITVASCVNHDLQPTGCSTVLETTVVIDATPSGCGAADGAATIIVSPDAMYRYSIGEWNQDHNFFSSLRAGRYLVLIASSAGCRDTVELLMPQPAESDLMVSSLVESDDECLSDNGSVKLKISGGVPPYNISSSTLTLDESMSALSVKSGTYSVTIEDRVNCTATHTFEVPRGNSGVSWVQNIKPIIETRCAKSGCHAAGSGRTTLQTYADVKRIAAEIRRRTQNRSMPYDEPLAENAINMIACWLDDGAAEN